MLFVLISLGYIAGNLALYVIWFRHVPSVKRESRILVYHLVSYLVFLPALAAISHLMGWKDVWAGVLLAAGLHGIYSLSFLELWTLTQGSYSLGILVSIAEAGGSAHPGDLIQLQSVGAVKKSSRNSDLCRLGLIRPDGTHTPFGRISAFLLRTILRLSQGRTMN